MPDKKHLNVAKMRIEYRKKLDALRKKHKLPRTPVKYTPPRYDDIYYQGVADLDRIARGDVNG